MPKISKSHMLQTAALMLSMPLSGMAIDIYVPSLPAVSQYFHVTQQLSQSSISYYLVGYALIQFIAGNISDSVGRRIPYLLGILLFIFSSSAIILTTKNIHYLLIWRLLEGVAAGMIIVPVRATIADLYSGSDYYKYANYATLAWSVGPIIAPALGGYLHYFFGWQSCFYFLIGYAAVILVLYLKFVPETRANQLQISFITAICNYRLFIANPEFVSGVLLQGLLYSIFILFSVVGPFLIQDELHYSVVDFGHIALIMGVSWFLGNLTNRLFATIDLQIKVAICLLFMFSICLLAYLVNLKFDLNLKLIISSSAGLLYFASLIYPNFFSKNTKIFANLSGSSSAIAGGGNFLTSALVGHLGESLKVNSSLPLIRAYLLIITLLFLAYSIQYHYANKQNKATSN